MKILQIGSVPPPFGGVATYCFETSKSLTKLGHQVILLTYVSKDEYKQLNDKVNFTISFPPQIGIKKKIVAGFLFFCRSIFSFDPRIYKYIYWVLYQRNLLYILDWFYNASITFKISKDNDIDIIFGHHANGRGLVALLVGRMLDRPSRIILYGSAIFHEINDTRMEKLVRGVLISEHRFFTCAQNTTERAIELGVNGKKIITLGVGVDGSKYPSIGNKNTDLDNFMLGFVGPLAPHRGLKELFNALSKIKVHIPSIRLIIIGPDPVNYWNELEDLIMELDIKEHVQYMGSVSDEDYLKNLSNFDVAVFPIQQRITASLLGALEAQALGIPVLTTGLGGVGEVVKNGKTGIICNRDSEGIYDGILRIYDGYKQNMWNRNEIRKWALTFSWEKIAKVISNDIS